jgi:hypothetical protein
MWSVAAEGVDGEEYATNNTKRRRARTPWLSGDRSQASVITSFPSLLGVCEVFAGLLSLELAVAHSHRRDCQGSALTRT